MSEESKIITTLLERYDYGGVYDLLDELKLAESNLAYIVMSCRRSINFDFDSALDYMYKCDGDVLAHPLIADHIASLKDLRAGHVAAVFSELAENIKIQLINYEYIDFLGRVYRFKEGIFKYMLIKATMPHKISNLNNEIMSKRYQLKLLRTNYKIYSSNISYAITRYFDKYQKDAYKAHQIIKILNANKMNELIELRNNSIVGHGFKGVSGEEIAKVFGNPYNVLDDFYACLALLDIKIEKYRYSKMNDFLAEMMKKIQLNASYSIDVLVPFE